MERPDVELTVEAVEEPIEQLDRAGASTLSVDLVRPALVGATA